MKNQCSNAIKEFALLSKNIILIKNTHNQNEPEEENKLKKYIKQTKIKIKC